MTDQDQLFQHLDIVYADLETGLNGLSGSPLHQIRQQSIESLRQVQFPGKKHEDWRYTPVQKLMTPRFKLAKNQPSYTVESVRDLDSIVIPVINGKVNLSNPDARLINAGIRLIPLHEAIDNEVWKESFGKFLMSSPPSANRAFELLNLAFHLNGFFLMVPKNTILETPIEIRIVHDDAEPSFSHPLYFIHCGSGSQIELIERFENNEASQNLHIESMINSLCHVYLEKNAGLKHIKWQILPAAQNLVYKLFVRQQKDSRFETFAFDYGGKLIRNNIEVELEEQNTFTSLQAGFLATGTQNMDHQTRINHIAPHCESHELYKGIIDDQASAAFNGKVMVHKDAQKTNAFQQNDALVLSRHALMNSKPQLEIFADDVKCSHGATIGQLDEKALFYLESRGIPEVMAKHMLKKAFITEVLDSMKNDKMRNHISSHMGLGE